MAHELSRFTPFDDVRQMQRLMDRFWFGFPRVSREDVEIGALEEPLAVDVFEQDGNLVVKAAMPGIDPKDIDVKVTEGVLQIRGETKTEENVEEGSWHRREFRYGKCSRAFRLPPDVDVAKAQAKYENGMLRLTFPKTQAAQAKSIEVKVG